jgi:hypothetical protein
MLSPCSHKFVWPKRGTDGHYYQVCVLCRVEYEYDWESMQRLHGEGMPSADILNTYMASTDSTTTDTGITDTATTDKRWEQVDSGQDTIVETEDVQADSVARAPSPAAFDSAPPETPDLKLLVETESAYRVFFRNLADLAMHRSSATATLSTPLPLWNDVFVSSGLPWWWFAESLLGHMIVITALLILLPKWPSGPIQQPVVFRRSSISYYAPPKAFPALRSHSPQVRPPVAPTPPPSIHVAPERAQGQGQKQKQGIDLPPDIMPAKAARLRITTPNSAAPMMPLSATGRALLAGPAGPTWVVAPPPDSSSAAARGLGLLQASAVAPAPEVQGVSSRRGTATSGPHTAVIAPPPSLSGSIRKAGDISIGESAVVKPAPQLPMEAQSAVAATLKGVLGGMGSAVVPPPPSIQSAGALSGGRAGLLAGDGSQVVPPAPSIQGTSDIAGGVRTNGLSPAGWQVVPPAPSVLGAGNATGDAAGNGRALSLSSGLQAVPPPPSLPGQGSGSGSGRANSLSGAGLQAAPPAPGVQGGSGGGGRGNSLSAGIQALPPSSSAQGEGGGGGDSVAEGASNNSGKAPAQSSPIPVPNEPATQEMPLRLIAPVLALPGSSYFSNYEVFIAERKLGKSQSQFIKLVYTSLPYQRRLSEYGPNYSMVYKLRVTRDQACDESLLEMTWPETDPRPDSQHAADSPALSSQDRKGMLPCYTTTADDYRRALARSH